MPEFWQRVIVAAVVIVVASTAAKLLDRRIAGRNLAPEAVTRYRVVRRTLFAAIVFVGIMSALLVIPQVRAIAGGVLASSAVIGLVIGFASQRTIGNVVAGVLIAFTQPLRLGDEVEIEGKGGTVEEIGLTYTWIRTPSGDLLVVPNEKLASSTIRNGTIRSPRALAEVTVQVPHEADLRAVVASLRDDDQEAYVTELGDKATVVVRKWVARGANTEQEESDLRIAVDERLKAEGV